MSKSYKKSKNIKLYDIDKEDKVKAHKKFRRTTKSKFRLNQDLPNSLKELDYWTSESIYDDNIDLKYLRK